MSEKLRQSHDHALDKTLHSVRRKLPKPQQQFSKFIHAPAIEQLSEAASATIARPSGLLVGGAFSLLSSFGLLVVCYHYGYTYNFLVAMTFFAGGFAVGVVVEAIARLFRR